MPYMEDPCDVRCVSFSPNDTILGGDVYQIDIYEDHKGVYSVKEIRNDQSRNIKNRHGAICDRPLR